MTRGLLLINLGTPNTSTPKDIKLYLHEFLMDKRVIDIPYWMRYLLVNGFIVPFRTKQTSLAYQLIWTEQGSPLLVHSKNLVNQLQDKLSKSCKVVLAMRYGKPSIKQALKELRECSLITVLPLYPQYSSAATGSAIEEIMQIHHSQELMSSLNIIRDFYRHPAYIVAQAELIKPYIISKTHLLFSYHGIPERQIRKSGCDTVCRDICPPISEMNLNCYKAQCHQTSHLLATQLQLKPSQYSTAFQSQIGKASWIKPYLNELLVTLRSQGINHLAIACPSFVTDCLETLEEIGIRAKRKWLELGGEEFTLVPCLNNDEKWITALLEITQL